jgi:hypothetical protein
MDFTKSPQDISVNRYQVQFSDGSVSLLIEGEGYGTVAAIKYLTKDGFGVPVKFLEPNWPPPANRKKKFKGPSLSQEQQIYRGAEMIKARDQDILTGNYSRLDEVAVRWKAMKEQLLRSH